MCTWRRMVVSRWLVWILRGPATLPTPLSTHSTTYSELVLTPATVASFVLSPYQTSHASLLGGLSDHSAAKDLRKDSCRVVWAQAAWLFDLDFDIWLRLLFTKFIIMHFPLKVPRGEGGRFYAPPTGQSRPFTAQMEPRAGGIKRQIRAWVFSRFETYHAVLLCSRRIVLSLTRTLETPILASSIIMGKCPVFLLLPVHGSCTWAESLFMSLFLNHVTE